MACGEKPNWSSPELLVRKLRAAVARDDLEVFQAMLTTHKDLLTWQGDNRRDKLLLNLVLKHESCRIFDYLLSFDYNDIRVNNLRGDDALNSALEHYQKSFAAELIKKGCDINADNGNCLHEAIKREWFDISDALIEKGANLNAFDKKKRTPLHIACKRGLTEQVFKLLSLGADPFISDSNNWSCADELAVSEDEQLREFFLNNLLTPSVALHIHVFTRMMQEDSLIFLTLLEMVELIKDDYCDLEQHLIANIAFFKPEYFRMFVDKFDWILEEAILGSDCLSNFCQIAFPQPLAPLSKNRVLDCYLENIGYILNNPSYSPTTNDYGIVHSIIESFLLIHRHTSACVGGCFLTEDDLEKIIYFFLTYGINPHFRDLDTIYKHFGYCELFKRLLHMDIEGVDFHKEGMLPLPRLIYDMDLTIERYVNNPLLYHKTEFDHVNSLFCLSHFSALPRLVYRDLLSSYEEFALIFGKLPDVPSLVELARNRSRDYIINKFQVKNSRQFYTVLQRLPIKDIHKQIIAFEMKIYSF